MHVCKQATCVQAEAERGPGVHARQHGSRQAARAPTYCLGRTVHQLLSNLSKAGIFIIQPAWQLEQLQTAWQGRETEQAVEH